ncbi:hypothetical protein ACN2C7_06495 [Caulobacter sp. ErkDOM-E]|uniref:hypothetical protein n=1 Tax=Caulobacter sp. ErkDOM-E TaxID=3402778 RepID=UPI003AF8EA45
MEVFPTLWPAPDADWRLSGELIAIIQQTVTEPLPGDISKLQRHNLVQKRVAHLGTRLGYDARIEVGAGYIARNGEGLFDVVWSHPQDQRSIAMEIDSSWRQRSLVKLGRAPAGHRRLWIYYGSRAMPEAPSEPGLRRINILQIAPELLGVRHQKRRVKVEASYWPGSLYPAQAVQRSRSGWAAAAL